MVITITAIAITLIMRLSARALIRLFKENSYLDLALAFIFHKRPLRTKLCSQY